MNSVKADELKEITNNVEIRYKWYKEVIEGNYYPLKDNNEGYLIDADKIKYGAMSNWEESYCNLPNNYYFKEYNFKITYQRVEKIRYIHLEDFTFNNNIKIYRNNEELDYKITINANSVIVDLMEEYSADTLTFYIKYEKKYKISLHRNRYLIQPTLVKNIENEEILIPDETWITDTTIFENYYTIEILKETGLTKKIKQSQICRYQEIYVYKYKINKEYYDDNYHLNVDGYIKDTNDYKIFYKIPEITNTIEITKEKIVKEPKIEYIYIPNEKNIEKNDSSEKIECTPQIKTQIKTDIKTVEKEIFKIPRKVYIIIIILILTIIFLIIKLNKKYVVQKN